MLAFFPPVIFYIFYHFLLHLVSDSFRNLTLLIRKCIRLQQQSTEIQHIVKKSFVFGEKQKRSAWPTKNPM